MFSFLGDTWETITKTCCVCPRKAPKSSINKKQMNEDKTEKSEAEIILSALMKSPEISSQKYPPLAV